MESPTAEELFSRNRVEFDGLLHWLRNRRPRDPDVLRLKSDASPRRDPMIRLAAYRAAEPFRPTQLGEIVAARRIVRKPIAELQHRARIFSHEPATTNCVT